MAPAYLAPEDDPTSIGNILIGMGLLDRQELTYLVGEFNIQREELLGEYIVKHIEKITEDDIEIAMIKQQRLRGKLSDTHLDRFIEISHKREGKVLSMTESLIAVIHAATIK